MFSGLPSNMLVDPFGWEISLAAIRRLLLRMMRHGFYLLLLSLQQPGDGFEVYLPRGVRARFQSTWQLFPAVITR